MARLKFNVHAYDLEIASQAIRRGLDAAIAALAIDYEKAVAEVDAYQGEPEQDEDGYFNDPRDGLIFDTLAIETTMVEVRKAMMVALYHAWERVARAVTRKTKSRDNHEQLIEALKAEGIDPDPELENLRLLVNLAKHNSKAKAEALWKARPDLLTEGFRPDQHWPDDWSDNIMLDDEQVTHFFAVVRASGPTHN